MGGFLIRLELGRMSLADRFDFFFHSHFFYRNPIPQRGDLYAGVVKTGAFFSLGALGFLTLGGRMGEWEGDE